MSVDELTPVQMFAAVQAAACLRAAPSDETLHSTLARIHHACGFNRAESSSKFLLGHSRGAAMTGAPAGLSRLAHVASDVSIASEITLRRRTVLGPYLALMSHVRRNLLISHCCESDPGRATVSAGLALNRVASSQLLRMCDECLQEQRAEPGFGYWSVAHQLPGAWVCERHRTFLRYVPNSVLTAKRWLSAEVCTKNGLLTRLNAPADTLTALERISACVRWLAGRSTVHPDILQVIARERLVSRGYLRNEASCGRDEYESVHMGLTAPLAAVAIPDFVGFRDGRWVRQVLVDRRNAHPLRWAVLLASDGPVDSLSLDVAYTVAAARVPHPSLFDEALARRSCAPEHVYRALGTPGTISEIARLSGLRKCELQTWLRKDPDLGVYRRRMLDDARRTESRLEIESYQRKYPQAFRSRVIRDCLRAVRWLESNDPELLSELLPTVQPKYSRQKRLDLGE